MTQNPKSLLDSHGIDPKKSLGQNFLHDPNMLEKIVDTADLMPDDTVVEVGPGTGAMTVLLARAARRVIAVELDQRMRPILEQQLAGYSGVSVLYDDVLKVDFSALIDGDYIVVANVPYYITSAILRHFLESPRRPRRLVLTMQNELAERISAQPGDLSLLAVSVQFYGQPRIMAKLPPAVFWPRPDVDSAVIRIDVYDYPPVYVPDEKTFFRVVRAGFSQKRKQLRNALAGGLAIKAAAAGDLLGAAGIDPQRRAETLTLQEWASLARAYAARTT